MKLPRLSSRSLIVVCLAAAACGGASNESTPEGTVMKAVQALHDDDLATFVRTTFTDDDLASARAEWTQNLSEAPSEDERAQFATTMAMLTAPGAEESVMLKVEPELAKLKPQVDMMLGMLEGMAVSAMAQTGALSQEEQAQAQAVLTACVETLRKNDVTDPARARKAVAVVCRTARALELKTLDEVQRLSFDAALGRGTHVLSGVKDLLDVYGFSIDSALGSAKTRTVQQSDTTATVELSYELLGTTRTQQIEMERRADRWVMRRDGGAQQGGVGG